MFVYIYMYMFKHMYIHILTYTYIYIYIHAYILTYIHIKKYICSYIYTHKYRHVCIVYMYIYTYAQMCIHTLAFQVLWRAIVNVDVASVGQSVLGQTASKVFCIIKLAPSHPADAYEHQYYRYHHDYEHVRDEK